MLRKNRISVVWIVLIAFIALLAVPISALAGGWVVVILDQLPDQVVAEQPARDESSNTDSCFQRNIHSGHSSAPVLDAAEVGGPGGSSG